MSHATDTHATDTRVHQRQTSTKLLVLCVQELQRVARRAPGSIDMRAATAAMLWAAEEEDKAEQEWSWACSKINSGQLQVRITLTI